MNPSAPAGLGGGHDLFDAGVGTPVGDVVADGDREEEGLVEDHADVGPQAGQRQVTDIVVVDVDRTVAHVVEAGHQPGHGGLAAAGPADQRHRLPRPQMQVEAGQHVGIPAVFDRQGHPAVGPVGEAHVLEPHVALAVGQVHRARPIDDGGLLVEDLVDALGRGCGTLAHHDQHAEHHEGRLHHQEVDVEGQDGPVAQVAVNDHVATEEQDQHQSDLGEVLDQRGEAGPQVGVLDVAPLHLVGRRRQSVGVAAPRRRTT